MLSEAETSDSSGQLCGNPSCSNLVGNDSSGVQCDFCKHWFHLSCTELDDASYKFLSETEFDSIVWKCDSCPSLMDILKNNIPFSMSEFEKLISNKIDSIETNIAKKINLAYKAKESVPSVKPSCSTTNITDGSSSSRSFPTNNSSGNNKNLSTSSGVNTSDLEKKKPGENEPCISPNNPSVGGRATAVKQSPVFNEICPSYRRGTCPFGSSGKTAVHGEVCQYYHPRKCITYCRYGSDRFRGCDGSCGLFHPNLCYSSVRLGTCNKFRCKYQHLLGTARFRKSNNSSADFNNFNASTSHRKHNFNYNSNFPRFAESNRVHGDQQNFSHLQNNSGSVNQVTNSGLDPLSQLCSAMKDLQKQGQSTREEISSLKSLFHSSNPKDANNEQFYPGTGNSYQNRVDGIPKNYVGPNKGYIN